MLSGDTDSTAVCGGAVGRHPKYRTQKRKKRRGKEETKEPSSTHARARQDKAARQDMLWTLKHLRNYPVECSLVSSHRTRLLKSAQDQRDKSLSSLPRSLVHSRPDEKEGRDTGVYSRRDRERHRCGALPGPRGRLSHAGSCFIACVANSVLPEIGCVSRKSGSRRKTKKKKSG